MSHLIEEHDPAIRRWVTAERWFMRYLGGALLVIAIVSLFSGIFKNPDNELIINSLNILVTILLLTVGIWTVWSSYNVKRIQSMVAGFLEQSARRMTIFGVVQIVVGALFVLEGLRGRWALLLLGLLLFSSAGWVFWRGMQVRQHSIA